MASQYNYERIKALAKEFQTSVKNLIALAPQNDPFYVGTETDWAKARWFADIYSRAGYGTFNRPHLRRVHYWIVSQSEPVMMPNGKPYENTEGCWGYLDNASKYARYLDLVPMNGLKDNKNPDPHINARYSYGSPEYLIDVPELNEPYVSVDNINDVDAQPYHLEVWCEKSTMNDVLLPVCQQFNANLVTFEGEVSTTSVCVELAARIRQANKPVRIFYISDFDPAGNSMPVAMARKIEFSIYNDSFLRQYDIQVKSIALTLEQVRQYRLPRKPIKDSEKRAASFEDAFGAGAVELDALEALYPGSLAQVVSDALEPYYSRMASQEVRRQRAALQQAVKTQVDEIVAKYQNEIDALQNMIDELNSVDVDASQYAVSRFEPHVSEAVTDDWLFDSKRPYHVQIGYYKAHKGQDSDMGVA